MENVLATQSAFQRLKGFCVPLLGNSLLTPSSTPVINKLLSQLHHALLHLQSERHVFAPATISYVFFPLSSILRRNDVSTIPDQTLEKILAILALLSDVWWWDMEVTAWEQIFMLCSAILGGIDRKGKGKDRDDETKLAAARTLWALLRERIPSEDPAHHGDRARTNLAAFIAHAQTAKFLPVMGQTLNSLLTTAESQHLPLQRMSLIVLSAIVKDYLPDGFVPSILPGTVSSMAKVALGTGSSRGWANGDIVAAALLVMEQVIVRAIGNDICIREGAIRNVDHLEDLVGDLRSADINVDAPPSSPYTTLRTATWLRATSSQLHIAINSLSPLVKHQTPAALIGLATFSAAVLSATAITLPQSQPLLLSFLLSLRGSPFERVSRQADTALRQLLTAPSSSRHLTLKVLLQISSDNLAALPRLLLSHADAKVEHAADILHSVCLLATAPAGSQLPAVPAISAGVGKLLGPHGGVEKWGWGLLSTLEFANPPLVVAQGQQASAAQLALEGAAHAPTPFPELALRHVSSRSAQEALARTFRALGATAREECLFAAEWFVDVGLGSRGQRAVAALWCACRLLEGAGGVELGALASMDMTASVAARRGKRLEKFARELARRIAESWDDWDDDEAPDQAAGPQGEADPGEENTLVEHVQGLVTVRGVPGAEGVASAAARAHPGVQPLLHRALSLQLLAVAAGILEARFLPLLLHVLYPVLHAVVSETSLVAASGLAALEFIASSTSYATPANLLLSNFDYALDAVSRRLTRRWLDVDATRVLAVLVRLVGRDVVRKAGDVVEECFDRLDEYHGYEAVVDGLVEVLGEVVRAVEEDEENRLPRESRSAAFCGPGRIEDARRVDDFVAWFAQRRDDTDDTENAGFSGPHRDKSYPREPWAKKAGEEGSEEEGATDGSAPPTTPPTAATQPGSRAEDDPSAEAPPTPAQALTTQIVARSVYLLTHGAPTVRARILLLLARSVPVLPEAALLPAVHGAWPFVLNRLADAETFVVSAAAAFVAALAEHVGDFMARRVWDDVWPRFRAMLQRLAQGDRASALARRAPGVGEGVGTASAYTHSHRLYRAIIVTMTAAARGVQAQDAAVWEVVVLFRRFLRRQAHEELQACARRLYVALAENNEDAVWLALSATLGRVGGPVAFLREPQWDIEQNVKIILSE